VNLLIKAMTGKKVFIPTLTDVVAFTDRVPVLTEKADEVTDVPSFSTQVQVEGIDEKISKNQEPALNVHALTQEVWGMLETEFKQMLKDEIEHLFEQQQVQMMERLGGKMRPLLAQALESKLTQVSSDTSSQPRTETAR
jgi:hypothetical protein